MGVALREKDAEGKTIKVHHLEFRNGFTSPVFGGGTLATKDPLIIKLLDESPRNIKNGGAEWKLDSVIPEVGDTPVKPLKQKDQPVPVKDQTPAPEPEKVPTKEVVPNDPEKTAEPGTVTEFPDITTVQFASKKVREIDPSIKTMELRNITQINAAAARLNISFPNL